MVFSADKSAIQLTYRDCSIRVFNTFHALFSVYDMLSNFCAEFTHPNITCEKDCLELTVEISIDRGVFGKIWN